MFQNKSDLQTGLFYAFICYGIWGLFPLYWKLLSTVAPLTVLSHRVIWSFVFLLIIGVFAKKYDFLSVFADTQQLLRSALAGLMIAINWGVYIYAVESNQLVDASLGYYINPLFNVLLGVLFFRERLNTLQLIAVGLAFSGVAYFTFQLGKLPWISLVLGLSFSFYGLLKKKNKVDSVTGLTVETLLIFPFALLYLIYGSASTGESFLTYSFTTYTLLVLAGAVTTIPLFWFGKAAQLLPLSTLGFIQYITPSVQLILAVILWQENFGFSHFICFALVWSGLFLFTYNAIRQKNKQRNP